MSLADVGCDHGLIIIIFQCGRVVGVVVPWLLWDMSSSDLNFWGWLRIDCDTTGRFITGCIVASS